MIKWLSVCSILFFSSIYAADIYVDAKAAPGGDGSKAKPLSTITAGIRAAKAGDTVNIRGGVYNEILGISKGGKAGAPLVIRGVPGERVVISGWKDITDWKDIGNGVYTAKVPSEVKDFYVGWTQQQCGRWPEDGTMRPVKGIDKDKMLFLTDPPKDAPFLEEIAKDPKNTVVFYFFAFGNSYGGPKLLSYDFKTGNIAFDKRNWNNWIRPEKNLYTFMNHPALVRQPGNWAYVADEKNNPRNTAGTVYFKPVKKEDLKHTRYRFTPRQQIAIGHWKEAISDITLQNLEVTGSGLNAIMVGGNTKNVTIENCLVHNNFGEGINFRGCDNVVLRNNLVIANRNGVSVISARKGLVEGNEIAYNLADGLIIAGNISGPGAVTPDDDMETYDITVRRNYIHHHILQAHPDNIQLYRGVHRVLFDSNFNIWSGQSLMTEQTDNIKMVNNVFLASSAFMIICGHGDSNKWEIINNTLGCSGYGLFSFTGKDYKLSENILWGCGEYPYDKEGKLPVTSDYNFFYPYLPNNGLIGRTTRPWKAFKTIDALYDFTKQDKNSAVGELKFKNAPLFLAVTTADGSKRNTLKLRPGSNPPFKTGDNIEVNGDGIMRKVESFSDGRITFTPELPQTPFRDALVMNWGKSNSTVIDLSLPADSPSRKIGKNGAGSNIDTVAFQNGDLLGKGKRTLPELPPEIKASLPNPNSVVIPLYP